jgi:Flp pilus assembly protein TadD
MSRSGVNAAVLNAVGECYLQMGRSEDALAAWERSLALDPGQPEIRKKADAIK